MIDFDSAEEPEGLFDQSDVEEPAENILLLGSDEEAAEACAAHVHAHPSEQDGVILVTLRDSLEQRLRAIQDSDHQLPTHIIGISVGEARRESDPGLPGVKIKSITDTSDLPRLGITISDALAMEASETPPTLCFHSLTVLLRYVETERVFRFVNTLNGRVKSAHGQAHFHLDPALVEKHAVATLRPLFDTVEDCIEQDEPSTSADSDE